MSLNDLSPKPPVAKISPTFGGFGAGAGCNRRYAAPTITAKTTRTTAIVFPDKLAMFIPIFIKYMRFYKGF
jgi:hypothetical protein